MRFRAPFWLAFCALWGIGHIAWSQNLVLDEEFNLFSATLTNPLRPTLVPNRQVHFVLVNDPNINAFVTPENLVFVHSGLVMQAQSAAELQGVLAHELAHLAAGHLQQREAQSQSALVPILAGAVLGAGAAIAGAPQAGVALALGGQAAGIQTLLNYSRVQEQEADQRALEALHKAGFSAQGMVGMFNTLRTQGQLSYDSPPPWLLTHPLPAERLTRLQAALSLETSKTTTLQSANWPRLQAKVAALTLTPAAVLRRYPGNTEPERYARALAQMRLGKLAEAERLLTPLRAAAPTDPFYLELEGQLASQQNNLPKATAAYRSALQNLPGSLLIRYQLAEMLRAQADWQGSAAHYREITRLWPVWSEPWAGYGRSLGRMGDLSGSHLAFAEADWADGDVEGAKQSVALAEGYLKTQESKENTQWLKGLKERLNLKDK